MNLREVEFLRLTTVVAPLSLACLFPTETARMLAKLKPLIAYVVAQIYGLVSPGKSNAKAISAREMGRAAALGLIGFAAGHASEWVGLIPGVGVMPGAVGLAVMGLSALKDYFNGPALPPNVTAADVQVVSDTKAHNAAAGYFDNVLGEPSAEDIIAHYAAEDAARGDDWRPRLNDAFKQLKEGCDAQPK